MNNIHTQRRFSYKDLLYKCLIFIVAVSIISYFMPKEGKFNYEFELETPWVGLDGGVGVHQVKNGDKGVLTEGATCKIIELREHLVF